MKDKEARKEIEQLNDKYTELKDFVKTLAKKEGYGVYSLFRLDILALHETEETYKRKNEYKTLIQKVDALADILGYEFDTLEAQPSKIIAVEKSEEKSDGD